MSVSMYIVGAAIFLVYMFFTIWNINHGSKMQEEDRQSEPDVMDMDGMGNFSRFPKNKK